MSIHPQIGKCMRYLALLGLIAAVPASAQSPQVRAANTITRQDITRRINIVAHDSMMGRDTPSPGLEKTASPSRVNGRPAPHFGCPTCNSRSG